MNPLCIAGVKDDELPRLIKDLESLKRRDDGSWTKGEQECLDAARKRLKERES